MCDNITSSLQYSQIPSTSITIEDKEEINKIKSLPINSSSNFRKMMERIFDFNSNSNCNIKSDKLSKRTISNKDLNIPNRTRILRCVPNLNFISCKNDKNIYNSKITTNPDIICPLKNDNHNSTTSIHEPSNQLKPDTNMKQISTDTYIPWTMPFKLRKNNLDTIQCSSNNPKNISRKRKKNFSYFKLDNLLNIDGHHSVNTTGSFRKIHPRMRNTEKYSNPLEHMNDDNPNNIKLPEFIINGKVIKNSAPVHHDPTMTIYPFNLYKMKDDSQLPRFDSSIECPLCLTRFPSSLDPSPPSSVNNGKKSNNSDNNNIYRLTSCGHGFCRDCLRRYFEIEINDGRVNIACPRCTEKARPQDLRDVLLGKDIKAAVSGESVISETIIGKGTREGKEGVSDSNQLNSHETTPMADGGVAEKYSDENVEQGLRKVCSETEKGNLDVVGTGHVLLRKWERFTLRRFLVSEPDARWCPAPDCGFALIATGCASCPMLKCERPGCNTYFCYHCKNEWHPNLTCDAAKTLRYNCNFNALFNGASTSSALATASHPGGINLDCLPLHSSIGSDSNIKVCPRCQAYIMKMDDGSCNHMTCAICGSEFCWLCMKEISDLHYLSPSGCTFWGKKPWSRKKKILWQLGTLVGAPMGIALIASIAIPAIIIGVPIFVGRKIYTKYKKVKALNRNSLIVVAVLTSVILSPIMACLAVSIGAPILLAYVYGVVPFSLCRNGLCGANTPSTPSNTSPTNGETSTNRIKANKKKKDKKSKHSKHENTSSSTNDNCVVLMDSSSNDNKEEMNTAHRTIGDGGEDDTFRDNDIPTVIIIKSTPISSSQPPLAISSANIASATLIPSEETNLLNREEHSTVADRTNDRHNNYEDYKVYDSNNGAKLSLNERVTAWMDRLMNTYSSYNNNNTNNNGLTNSGNNNTFSMIASSFSKPNRFNFITRRDDFSSTFRNGPVSSSKKKLIMFPASQTAQPPNSTYMLINQSRNRDSSKSNSILRKIPKYLTPFTMANDQNEDKSKSFNNICHSSNLDPGFEPKEPSIISIGNCSENILSYDTSSLTTTHFGSTHHQEPANNSILPAFNKFDGISSNKSDTKSLEDSETRQNYTFIPITNDLNNGDPGNEGGIAAFQGDQIDLDMADLLSREPMTLDAKITRRCPSFKIELIKADVINLPLHHTKSPINEPTHDDCSVKNNVSLYNNDTEDECNSLRSGKSSSLLTALTDDGSSSTRAMAGSIAFNREMDEASMKALAGSVINAPINENSDSGSIHSRHRIPAIIKIHKNHPASILYNDKLNLNADLTIEDKNKTLTPQTNSPIPNTNGLFCISNPTISNPKTNNKYRNFLSGNKKYNKSNNQPTYKTAR
ncbi:uncharacterized protein LOC135922752 isoform X2 [Gordionus sp. m RMFG-2023]|uniref:uncharacterized protein LOC135922752 isoform X2 n=1 Tax=Gordionus sp. m RMFG-2023 TaxID=3053472 RepID=UPI0031FC6A59